MVVGLVVVFCGSRENAVPNSLSSAMGAGCGSGSLPALCDRNGPSCRMQRCEVAALVNSFQ